MAQLLKHYDNLTQIKLYRVSGMVVDSQTASTTHTHVSGGGGKIHNGTGYIEPIRTDSYTTTEHDIYLKLDTGQIQHCYIGDDLSHVKFRNGHYIDLFYIEGRIVAPRPRQMQIALNNRTINKYYFNEFFGNISEKATNPVAIGLLLRGLTDFFFLILLPSLAISYLLTYLLIEALGLGTFGWILVIISLIVSFTMFFKRVKRQRLDLIKVSYQTCKQVKRDIAQVINGR